MTEQEVRAKYRELTKTLIEKKIEISTMESCTSGLVASLITDTEGASAVLKGAFVTYSNIGKIMMGVPEETIDTYSVYSAETAQAMAEACKKTYKAQIGVGVTGTMGNVDPANAAASTPGQVYFALATDNGTLSFHRELTPKETRLEYKMTVCGEIVEELLAIVK